MRTTVDLATPAWVRAPLALRVIDCYARKEIPEFLIRRRLALSFSGKSPGV